MDDDDKTTTDDPTSNATVEPTKEPKAETNGDADEKLAEEASKEEPKADEPESADAAAAPAANTAQSAGTDQQGRTLYNVKCSNCGRDTQVPFKPSGDRPVYCRDCYMQKKNSQV